jgi:hypothetical protein
MINATPAQLRRAADIKERIDALQNQLNEILGVESSGPVEAAGAPAKGRKVSAAGRARMRAAQLARWAKIKGTGPSATPVNRGKRKLSAQGLANIRAGVAKRVAALGNTAKPPRKRKMSPAAKKKLAALMTARWANARKAGKARL